MVPSALARAQGLETGTPSRLRRRRLGNSRPARRVVVFGVEQGTPSSGFRGVSPHWQFRVAFKTRDSEGMQRRAGTV